MPARHTGNILAADTGAKLRTSWPAPASPRSGGTNLARDL
jgi:hypothetical protein